MNEHRTQQQFSAKIAEIERQQREICKQYGLHIIPDEPKQPETGDKRTLTPRRKCGIIKAIRRHVRRWKRKQEGKTMTIYGRKITNEDMQNIAEYMDDTIREELRNEFDFSE